MTEYRTWPAGCRRLVEMRGRPELANPQMENWAAYLAGQAHALPWTRGLVWASRASRLIELFTVIDVKKTRKPRRESAQFVGRAVAALSADPGIMTKTGQILVSAELAREYGFEDTDGTQPEPIDDL
jgi:hypothetical protein